MSMRLPVVGVMGSGEKGHAPRAEVLGRWLATQRVHLLTGGGKGVMTSVSRAFHETPNRAGLVVGVIPCGRQPTEPKPGYPNPWVELAIYTHLYRDGTSGADPMSRNHINILSSNVVVALPGSSGTLSEITLAVRYSRPIAVYLEDNAEMPDVPQQVPIIGDLAGIQEFVCANLPAG
ncbi:MAG: hypothetical protein ACR2OF_01825 [Hyphomicrobium sp.]